MTNRTFSHNCTATVTIDLDFGKHDKINSLQRQQWHNDKLQRKQDAKLNELEKYNHCCQPNPYNIYIRRKFDSHRRSTTSHASAITLSRTSIHPQTRGARVWSSHSHSQSQASSLRFAWLPGELEDGASAISPHSWPMAPRRVHGA